MMGYKSPVTVVVGAQYGDEGKGRIVDLLAAEAGLVARFQGGNNAGHTIVNEYGEFRLHLVPAGIFRKDVTCLIGAGVVVDPKSLLEELADIESKGVEVSGLRLSERAHVVTPYHRLLDGLDEKARGSRRIGTTLRGVGPAYTDKVARRGIQVADLFYPEFLREKLEVALGHVNALLRGQFGEEPLELDPVFEELSGSAEALRPYVCDGLTVVREALQSGRGILAEGQLGAQRDLDWGVYPFVTSSSPISGAITSGAGIPPTAITEILGVTKAYTTAVGEGPMPTELHDADGVALRERGGEYGATTGRPRRCGWFDAVAVRYAAGLNGMTGLALTKLDVLDEFAELPICVGYRVEDGAGMVAGGGPTEGALLDTVPPTPVLTKVTPVYEKMPGWRRPTRGARKLADLPAEARRYVERIEELVGVPAKLISVGREREEFIRP